MHAPQRVCLRILLPPPQGSGPERYRDHRAMDETASGARAYRICGKAREIPGFYNRRVRAPCSPLARLTLGIVRRTPWRCKTQVHR
jgi:hypothetical protein